MINRIINSINLKKCWFKIFVIIFFYLTTCIGTTEDELISSTFSSVRLNIRKLSAQQIDEIIESSLQRASCARLNRNYILRALKSEIQRKINYYNLIAQKKDNKIFHKGILFSFVGIGCLGLLFIIYKKLYKSSNQEIDSTCRNLDNLGISVSTFTLSENYASAWYRPSYHTEQYVRKELRYLMGLKAMAHDAIALEIYSAIAGLFCFIQGMDYIFDSIYYEQYYNQYCLVNERIEKIELNNVI